MSLPLLKWDRRKDRKKIFLDNQNSCFMRSIPRHSVLYPPPSKTDKYSFRIPASEFMCLVHTSVLLKKRKQSLKCNINKQQKLNTTWNVIRSCSSTKTVHIQQKYNDQTPTWTTVHWLKRRHFTQTIKSHHPQWVLNWCKDYKG